METIDLKVVFLGPVNVGKTCLINRYCNGTFNEQTKSTIGASFIAHTRELKGCMANIMVWDTAGSERFNSVTPMIMRGCEILVLVFDLSDPSTLDNLEPFFRMLDVTWTDGSEVPILLIGNKTDLRAKTNMEDIQKWMRNHRIKRFVRVSAKTGDGVVEMMDGVIDDFITKYVVTSTGNPVTLHLEDRPRKTGCC